MKHGKCTMEMDLRWFLCHLAMTMIESCWIILNHIESLNQSLINHWPIGNYMQLLDRWIIGSIWSMVQPTVTYQVTGNTTSLSTARSIWDQEPFILCDTPSCLRQLKPQVIPARPSQAQPGSIRSWWFAENNERSEPSGTLGHGSVGITMP